MLTPRERRNLRDRVARTAISRRLPNPLVTRDEREEENLDLVPLLIEHHQMDPKNWGSKCRRFTMRSHVRDRKEAA